MTLSVELVRLVERGTPPPGKPIATLEFDGVPLAPSAERAGVLVVEGVGPGARGLTIRVHPPSGKPLEIPIGE